jgi:hypothetical protein
MITQFMGSLRARGDERRRAPRTRIDSPGELLACPATARTVPVRVQVRDVSATGVGLVHASPLPLGQRFVVRQATFPTDQPRLYTVVRSDATGDGTFSVGLHAANDCGPAGSGSPGPAQERSAGTVATLLMVLVILAAAAMLLY